MFKLAGGGVVSCWQPVGCRIPLCVWLTLLTAKRANRANGAKRAVREDS